MIPQRTKFYAIIAVLTVVMGATFPYLVKHTKIGLEFKGGYEIVYQAEPLQAGVPVTHQALIDAADIVAARANKLGVSEPQVNVLGNDLIRVVMAGVKAGDPIVDGLHDFMGLPVKLTPTYSETVGGVLGASDLRDTTSANSIALGIIFAFLVAAYRDKGFIAIFTTVTSLWLMLVAFVALNATLSLAAIVAFVLGFGIASGANIIAFERSREAAREGRSNGHALLHGHRAAFWTIVNASASVLICACILLVIGIGPIKGFALTTIFSILISFLSNVLLARFLVHLMHRSDSGFRLFWRNHSRDLQRPAASFDFVRWSKYAIVASALFTLGGAGSVMLKPLNFDIEFKAGTALDVQIDKPITQDAATEVIANSGVAPATVAIGGNNQNTIAARFDDVLNTQQVNAVVAEFKKVYGPDVTFAENTADPAVAANLARQSVAVILFSLLGTAAFIWARFNWRMALASVVSVVSAFLFVMSSFAIFSLEIDITFIAAMLIVIGFALNEAVVVFDRIRENSARR